MWKIISILILLLLLCGSLIIWMTLAARTGASQDEIVFTNDELIAEQKEKELEEKERHENREKEEDVATDKRAFYVTQDECEKECTSFAKNTEGWRYCANICGIIKENQDTNLCEKKTGLSHDYCISEKAQKDKDISQCDAITDKGIREKCIKQTKEQILDAF